MNIKFLFLAAGIAVFSDNCYCMDKDEYVNPYERLFKTTDKLMSPLVNLFMYQNKYESPQEWATALKQSKSSIDWYKQNPNEEFLCSGIVYDIFETPRLTLKFLRSDAYKKDKKVQYIFMDLLKLSTRAWEADDKKKFDAIYVLFCESLKLMETQGVEKIYSDPSFQPIFSSFMAVIASHFDYEH